jgi:hypothetical protein
MSVTSSIRRQKSKEGTASAPCGLCPFTTESAKSTSAGPLHKSVFLKEGTGVSDLKPRVLMTLGEFFARCAAQNHGLTPRPTTVQRRPGKLCTSPSSRVAGTAWAAGGCERWRTTKDRRMPCSRHSTLRPSLRSVLWAGSSRALPLPPDPTTHAASPLWMTVARSLDTCAEAR